MTPEQKHRAAILRRHTVCGLAHLGDCEGRLQADHIIERQAIKRRRSEAALRRRVGRDPLPGDEAILAASLDDLISDGRNGWLLCDGRHHPAKWRVGIDVDWLPLEVDDFARDYGLTFELLRLAKPLVREAV